MNRFVCRTQPLNSQRVDSRTHQGDQRDGDDAVDEALVLFYDVLELGVAADKLGTLLPDPLQAILLVFNALAAAVGNLLIAQVWSVRDPVTGTFDSAALVLLLDVVPRLRDGIIGVVVAHGLLEGRLEVDELSAGGGEGDAADHAADEHDHAEDVRSQQASALLKLSHGRRADMR